MSPDERSETAHRTVTRMVDAALRNPSDIDLETMIADHIKATPGPHNAILHTLTKGYREGEHSTSETLPNGSVSVPVPKEGERGTLTFTVPGEQSGNGREQSDEQDGSNR